MYVWGIDRKTISEAEEEIKKRNKLYRSRQGR
jgi:hypothetical protein